MTTYTDPLAVGILAAGAVGSKLTQDTLNTFHTAGNNNDLITGGIKRIEECFNNSSTLSKIIYRVGKHVDCRNLVYISMKKLTRSVELLSNDQIENCKWIHEFQERFGEIQFKKYFNICVRLDYTTMYENDINLTQLLFLDYKRLQPLCISPIIRDDLGVFIDLILVLDWLDEEELLFNEFKNFSCFLAEKKMYFFRKFIEPYIINLHVQGLDNVEKVVEMDSYKLIICDTFSCLVKMIIIDPINIVCNKTNEMLDLFGIEVAKQCLIEELYDIIPDIAKYHIILIVNVMTWSGKINSMSRYTARQNDVLDKISFEEAIRNIVCSCLKGERDDLKSCSSRIFTSKLVNQTDAYF